MREGTSSVDDERMDRDELAARLDGQARARELIARAAVPAPGHLRARIEELRAPAARPRRTPRRRGLFAGGFAAAAAVVAALLVLLLPGGAGGPDLAQAVGLATLPATAAAPGVDPGAPALLDASVDGVAFPAWADEFGWIASGSRADEIGGRRVVTVFYEKEGRTIAYSIVSGDGLAAPGEPAETRDGVAFRVLEGAPGLSVVWEREGRTCVLSGADTPRPKLIDLAAWRGAGAVAF